MNANELADFIDGNVSPFIDDHQEYLDKATAMLRQQQAEIKVLKHWQETWLPFLKEHFGINK